MSKVWKVKCPKCGHVFSNSYWKTSEQPGTCPKCSYSGSTKTFKFLKLVSERLEKLYSEIALDDQAIIDGKKGRVVDIVEDGEDNVALVQMEEKMKKSKLERLHESVCPKEKTKLERLYESIVMKEGKYFESRKENAVDCRKIFNDFTKELSKINKGKARIKITVSSSDSVHGNVYDWSGAIDKNYTYTSSEVKKEKKILDSIVKRFTRKYSKLNIAAAPMQVNFLAVHIGVPFDFSKKESFKKEIAIETNPSKEDILNYRNQRAQSTFNKNYDKLSEEEKAMISDNPEVKVEGKK